MALWKRSAGTTNDGRFIALPLGDTKASALKESSSPVRTTEIDDMLAAHEEAEVLVRDEHVSPPLEERKSGAE